jgi:hypothetical protein
MSIQLAAVPVDKGLTDLSILGVPESAQTRGPSIAGFPRKFNPDSLKVWKSMLEDPEFKNKVRQWASNDLAWHHAIQDFLSRCDAQGVFPFQNNTDTTRNEFIQDFVRRGRLDLMQFVNESGIFKRARVKKVFREYTRKDSGLIINSWAELFPIKEPGFEKWLTTSPMPRFIPSIGNKYVKVVRPNVVMWVRYINDNKVTIGFSIEVAGTINIPGKKTPKRKEVDKYIDNNIYLPTVRAHRFNDVKNRLF